MEKDFLASLRGAKQNIVEVPLPNNGGNVIDRQKFFAKKQILNRVIRHYEGELASLTGEVSQKIGEVFYLEDYREIN